MAATAFASLTQAQKENIKKSIIRELRKRNLNNDDSGDVKDAIEREIVAGEDV